MEDIFPLGTVLDICNKTPQKDQTDYIKAECFLKIMACLGSTVKRDKSSKMKTMTEELRLEWIKLNLPEQIEQGNSHPGFHCPVVLTQPFLSQLVNCCRGFWVEVDASVRLDV